MIGAVDAEASTALALTGVNFSFPSRVSQRVHILPIVG